MIQDKEALFSDAQLVTTGSENGITSTNVIDLGVARDIGAGEDIHVAASINTTMVGPSSDTLRVDVVTDDNADMTTPVVIQSIGSFPANSVAGAKLIGKLSPSSLYERYIALVFTAVDSALTAGKVDAGLVKDPDNFRAYAKGYTIS